MTAGRERPQVRAVIDLDGTMLGEETGFADGKYQMNTEPYPVPLLCIDTSEHYEQGQRYGDQYVNHVILRIFLFFPRRWQRCLGPERGMRGNAW